jgi:hypothetical protein
MEKCKTGEIKVILLKFKCFHTIPLYRRRGKTGEARQRKLTTGAGSTVMRFFTAGLTGKNKFTAAAGRTTKFK